MAKSRKHRTGMIVVRKLSGTGLGNLKNTSSFAGAVVPPVLGGGLTLAGTVGLEMLAKPEEGVAPTETQVFLKDWSAALGTAVGAVGSLAMFAMVGAPQGMAALAGSLATGIALGAKKMLDQSAWKFDPETGAAIAVSTDGYRRGYGAVIAQPSNMRTGAIVMAPVARNTNTRGAFQARGPSAGEVVTLGSINTAAFGTPGFLQGARR